MFRVDVYSYSGNLLSLGEKLRSFYLPQINNLSVSVKANEAWVITGLVIVRESPASINSNTGLYLKLNTVYVGSSLQLNVKPGVYPLEMRFGSTSDTTVNITVTPNDTFKFAEHMLTIGGYKLEKTKVINVRLNNYDKNSYTPYIWSHKMISYVVDQIEDDYTDPVKKLKILIPPDWYNY